MSGIIQSVHDQTELGHVCICVCRGGGGDKREMGERGATRGEYISPLYTEEPLGEGLPRPWGRVFRIGGRICKA